MKIDDQRRLIFALTEEWEGERQSYRFNPDMRPLRRWNILIRIVNAHLELHRETKRIHEYGDPYTKNYAVTLSARYCHDSLRILGV